MRRRKIGTHTLSERVPSVATVKDMDLNRFPVGIETMIERFLDGLLVYDNEPLPSGYIKICTDCTAYALKLLVEYGTSTLPARVRSSGTDTEFRLELAPGNPLPEEVVLEICRALSLAGFEAELIDGVIVATTPLTRTRVLHIRARTVLNFYYDIVERFFW